MGGPRRFALLCAVAVWAWIACIFGFVQISRPRPVAAAPPHTVAGPYAAPSLDVVSADRPAARNTRANAFKPPDLQLSAVDATTSNGRHQRRHKRTHREPPQKPEEPPVEVASDLGEDTLPVVKAPEPRPTRSHAQRRKKDDPLTRAFEREEAVIERSGDTQEPRSPRRFNSYRRRLDRIDRRDGDFSSRGGWRSIRRDVEHAGRFTIWD